MLLSPVPRYSDTNGLTELPATLQKAMQEMFQARSHVSSVQSSQAKMKTGVTTIQTTAKQHKELQRAVQEMLIETDVSTFIWLA